MTKSSGTRQSIRDAGRDDLEPVLDELELHSSIAAIAEQDGGKAVVKALTEDVISSVEVLAYQYQNLTHEQLVTKCAKLCAHLDLYLLFKRARKNTDDARKYIKDALDTVQ